MAYEVTVWSNGEAPAINADNLNKLEQGVADAMATAENGVPGPPGPQGEIGPQGPAGNDSMVPGPPGLPGENGTDGANGSPGTPGDPGANGASAFEVAVGSGFNGNVQQWLVSLQGTNGANGQNGIDGQNGANGANGVDGRTVLSGAGVPSSSNGNTGDFWVDTTAVAIYGPKSGNTWGNATSLVGPKGDTGNTGNTGANGNNGAAGANGAPGANGTNGTNGSNGVGVPAGGNAGQYLTKSDNNNYNTQWSTLPEIPTLNVFTCRQNGAISNMNNNLTLNNVANMAFSVVNGRRYFFKFQVSFTSTISTCGVGFTFLAPTMTASFFTVAIQQAAAGTDMFYTNTAFNNLATKLTSASVSANNMVGMATIEGVIQPSNNGTLQLQAFPEVNNNASIYDGGFGFMMDGG